MESGRDAWPERLWVPHAANPCCLQPVRAALVGPFEDGKHLPEPARVLPVPATVSPHERHAAAPVTPATFQLPDGSALQPKLLESQGQGSWPRCVQPTNAPLRYFSLPMDPLIPPHPDSVPAKQDKRGRSPGDYFWWC